MPNVEHTRMTSADVWLMNNSEELIGLINECTRAIPELQYIGASPIAKTEYKTLLLKALPKVGFRESNVGRKQEKATLGTEPVACKFIDGSWSLDEKVALECEWGVDAAITIQAQAHLTSVMQHIGVQTYYGTQADATGFQGLASLLPFSNSEMVVDAGGTKENAATSIFAIKTGIQDVQYAWGQNGQIKDGEIVYCEQYDKDMGKFWGYAQPISGYVGLQIPSTRCIGRICNITDEPGHRASEKLVARLLEMFSVGMEPDMFFMTKQSQGQIRDERTATTAEGKEAPYPETIFKIPLHVTEAISNKEKLLVPA